MEAIQFRQANMVLTGPDGSDIHPLPVFANQDENTLTSLWKPTEEERQVIAQGGCVVLSILGGAHPPVKVGAAVVDFPQPVPADEDSPAS